MKAKQGKGGMEEFENPMISGQREGGESPSVTPATMLEEGEGDLTEEEFAAIENVFEKMDKDHNGSVSREELEAALLESPLNHPERPLTDEDIDRVMRSLDTDGSGEISAEEFRAREAAALERMKGLYQNMQETYTNIVSCHNIAAIWVAFFLRCQRYGC